MYYIFEKVDHNGSRKRVIYNRLRNMIIHSLKYRSIPHIKRNANSIK